MIAAVLLTILCCVLLAAIIRQAYLMVRSWYEYQKAHEEVLAGVIPANYDQVKRLQETTNARDSGELEFLATPIPHEQLMSIRTRVSSIRGRGYDAGSKARRTNDNNLHMNPFEKGTGESKQWVRGYCMGAGIADIKALYRSA